MSYEEYQQGHLPSHELRSPMGSSEVSAPSFKGAELKHLPERRPRTHLRSLALAVGLVGLLAVGVMVGSVQGTQHPDADVVPDTSAVPSPPAVEVDAAPEPRGNSSAAPDSPADALQSLATQAARALDAEAWDEVTRLLDDMRAHELVPEQPDTWQPVIDELSLRLDAERAQRDQLEQFQKTAGNGDILATHAQYLKNAPALAGRYGDAIKTAYASALDAWREDTQALMTRTDSDNRCSALGKAITQARELADPSLDRLKSRQKGCQARLDALGDQLVPLYKGNKFAEVLQVCRQIGQGMRERTQIGFLCTMAACHTNKARLARLYQQRTSAGKFRNNATIACHRAGIEL